MRKQQDTLVKAIAHMEDIAATAAKAKEAGSFVTDTAPTTVKEWKHAKGLVMGWCIRDDADCDDVKFLDQFETDEEYHKAIGNIRLDYTAPEGTPDGVHRVRHTSWGKGSNEGYGEGVVVKDGKFEPISTEEAVLTAVALSFYADPMEVRIGDELNHVFIEGFSWNEELQLLDVFMGS